MKRFLLVLAAVALATGAAACTGSSDSGGSDGSTKKTEKGTKQEDAPEVVWQQVASTGFTPRHQAAGDLPAVTIYDDGRIFVDATDVATAYDHPAVFEVGTVDPDDLEAFLSKAEGSGVFSGDTGFGEPDVPGLPITTVALRTAGKARTVDVVGIGFDETAGGTEQDNAGITEAQTKNRNELRKLLGEANGLGGKRKQYQPDRVRATIVPGPEAADADATAWPGPAFDEFPKIDPLGQSCLVIEGPQAKKVYDAARKNETIEWSKGDEVRSIVVAPLLPGQEGCPPAE